MESNTSNTNKTKCKKPKLINYMGRHTNGSKGLQVRITTPKGEQIMINSMKWMKEIEEDELNVGQLILNTVPAWGDLWIIATLCPAKWESTLRGLERKAAQNKFLPVHRSKIERLLGALKVFQPSPSSDHSANTWKGGQYSALSRREECTCISVIILQLERREHLEKGDE